MDNENGDEIATQYNNRQLTSNAHLTLFKKLPGAMME